MCGRFPLWVSFVTAAMQSSFPWDYFSFIFPRVCRYISLTHDMGVPIQESATTSTSAPLKVSRCEYWTRNSRKKLDVSFPLNPKICNVRSFTYRCTIRIVTKPHKLPFPSYMRPLQLSPLASDKCVPYISRDNLGSIVLLIIVTPSIIYSLFSTGF